MNPFPERGLIVFSHPNHELAVFGLLQQLERTCLVYLTDGGGADRVAQTREGLSRIGRLEDAVFLDHAEEELYRRLVDSDAGFFQSVAEEVADQGAAFEPDAAFADAVEFYNPVHDLATPILRASLGEHSPVRRWEIPLVGQVDPETYVIQRLPVEPGETAQSSRLSSEELEQKRSARDEVYTLLAEQFGTTLQDLSDEHLGTEWFRPAPGSGFRLPGADYTLRYERRGRKLLEEGAVSEVITLRDHFLPAIERLVAGQ